MTENLYSLRNEFVKTVPSYTHHLADFSKGTAFFALETLVDGLQGYPILEINILNIVPSD